MAGSATLDPNVLVDSLVTGVIDGLRDALHPQFGVRPYRVFAVRRAWSGDVAGMGSFQDTETELTPWPRVARWDGMSYQHMEIGRESEGMVKVTEVSLTYTFDELVGANLCRHEQWFIKITEANGQGTPPMYFTHAKPPYVDRERDMGWVLWLRDVSVPCND